MQNQLTSFLKGVDQAACQWFGEYGGALESIGFALAVTPEPLSTKVGVGLMLANAAAQKGCEFDPNKQAPGGDSLTGIDGCYKVSGGGADLNAYRADGTFDATISSRTNYVEILGVTQVDNNTKLRIDLLNVYGDASYIYYPRYNPVLGLFVRFEELRGNECLATRDDHQGDLTPEDLPPVTYIDEDNGCEMNITFKGYAEGAAGEVFQITQIEPANSLRANGGVIGGCFFNPTIVVNQIGGGGGSGGGGGGLPPVTFPTPDPVPPPGDPWWKDFVEIALGGVVGALIERELNNILDEVYPGVIYRMVSVCEKDAQGEPISEAVEVPIEPQQAPGAQIARLDAIVELLQASKNFKQPVCPNEKPILEGEWRTISFRSETTSPYGRACLRKRFRYRSLSGLGLGDVVDHWKDFTFESGQVIVSHKGYSWGTPQVWAATADEGKRVIQHAAGEAGFDADQVGEWVISSSTSARYGVSAQMRVDTRGGYYWITARDGSNDRPIVARISDP